jgi:ribonuclease G
MSNILVINASGQETRVALIEQGTISEYYLERKNEKGIVGNIYKGRVVRVLPGMQAAFVDIGLEKAAFLYVADIVSDPSFPGFSEEIEIQAGATEGDPLEVDDVAEPPVEDVVPAPAAAQEPAPSAPVQEGEQGAEQVAAGTGSEPAAAPEPAAAGTAPVEQAEAPAASGAPEGAEPAQVPASAAARVENEDVVELSAEEAL